MIANAPSIAVLKGGSAATEHGAFTQKWKQLIPYLGPGNYDDISPETIWAAAQRIYAQYPVLLEEARRILGK